MTKYLGVIMNVNKLFKRFMAISVASLIFVFESSAQINEIPRATPESQGILSKSVIAFFDSMMTTPKTDIHSIMIMRHGNVVAETYPKPFSAEYKHTLFSCSKTFVSAAVGIAIGENKLRLSDRVATYFIGELPDSISDNLANMTVRDLLTMSSGIQPDGNIRVDGLNWTKTFLSRPVALPGKKFRYDSLCTYLLSAIVQKVTGMSLLDYLKIHIFEPLHITEVEWEVSPENYNTGGWGLYLQSESLAKFGQLLLNKGKWGDKQLIPSYWVKEMMKKQIENGSEGYGYQMWCCEHNGAMRADGMYGQYIYIIPDKDMVVVVTQCSTYDSKKERALLWNVLLPGVKPNTMIVGKDYKVLEKKALAYSLPVVKGKSASKDDLAYADKKITLSDNKLGWKTMQISVFRGKIVITVTNSDNKKFNMDCGNGNWLTTHSDVYPVYNIYPKERFKGVTGPFYISASYGMNDKKHLNVKAYYVNWVTVLDMLFIQKGNDISIEIKENNAAKPYVIKGRIG